MQVSHKLNYMPSNRKRIGFLPAVEVQNIINGICLKEKISQSKVTGFLVEEALYARGLLIDKEVKKRLNNHNSFKSNNIIEEKINIDDKTKDILNSRINYSIYDNSNFTKEEYYLFLEFLEYKKFKTMINMEQGNIK